MKLLPSAPTISKSVKKISADSIRGEESGLNLPKKKLISIRSRVVKIEKLLGQQNKLYERQKKKVAIQEEKQSRTRQESKLEKPKPKEEDKGAKNLLKGPKLGFLDRIKSFIGKLLFGFIALKLLPYLPQLLSFIPKIDAAATWISNFGIGIVDGFGTFVKSAYELRDKTIGFIDDLGGESLVNNFKKFEGAVDTVITTLVFAAAAGGKGGILDAGMEVLGDRLTQRGAQQAASNVAGQAARTGGMAAGTAAAIVGGVGLLSSALGEGAFQLRGSGKKTEELAKKNYEKHKDKWAIDPRRALSWGMYQAARFGNTMLSTVGFLLDVVGAPFRYAIELIRYPFLNEEDKKKQAKNLAKFDARIREDVRKALNMVTLGTAFKEKGSFGNMFGNDAAQKEMMSKMAGGGITRGGKQQGSVSRQLKEKKAITRTAPTSSQKTKIQPGDSVGGKNEIQKVFPESKKKDTVSPLTYIQDINKDVSEMPFLGPIFGVAYKTLLGDQADNNDYKNIAGGLNRWTKYTFNMSGSKMKLAGGGEVSVDMLMQGEDMTNALAKNVKGIISNDLSVALSSLRRQLTLDAHTRPKTDTGVQGADSSQVTSLGSGGGSLKDMTDRDFEDLAFIVSAEAARGTDDEYGVAAAILNRVADPRYPDTIMGVGTAPGQFEAVYKGLAKKDPALAKKLKDNQGKIVDALKKLNGRTDFKGQSLLQNKGDTDIMFHPRGNFFHYSEQRSKRDPIPGNIPTGWKKLLGPSTGGSFSVSSSGATPLGQGTSSFTQFDAIASKFGLSMTSSYRAGDRGYHGKNRARDYSNDSAGNGTPEQLAFAKELVKQYGSSLTQLIYTPLGFGIANGKKVPLSYWGSATNAAHYHHVHVALASGGKVNRMTRALIGEEGPEFVIDANSTKALEDNFPGFLGALNRAKYDQAIGILRDYASYEVGATQTAQIPMTIINNIVQSQRQNSGGVVVMSGGGDIDDYGEALAAGQ